MSRDWNTWVDRVADNIPEVAEVVLSPEQLFRHRAVRAIAAATGRWFDPPRYAGDPDIVEDAVRAVAADLKAACARLVLADRLAAASEECAKWFDWTTEFFDSLATKFYRETRYMAPGKDVPMEMNPGKEWERERRPAWDKWIAFYRDKMLAEHAECLAAYLNTGTPKEPK